jgi:esterase/lipase
MRKNILNPKHYIPSGYNSEFDFTGTDFSDYIDHSRRKIRLARLDLQTDYPEKIVEANCPFVWLTDNSLSTQKRAVLLVHGLYDSPFSLRDIGHLFYKEHFSVYSLLLPGHGTVPGDLLTIHRESWRDALFFAMNYLTRIYDSIYLCGFSTGGLLCIDYHLSHPHIPLDGIITLAPPIKIKSFAAPLAPLISYCVPWIKKRIENNYTKYRSFPCHAVAEVYRLAQEVQHKLKHHAPLSADILMSFSMADHIVSPKAAQQFFGQFASEESQCLIYQNSSLDHADAQDHRIHYTNNQFAMNAPNILQHNGLPFPPNNLHYGAEGDYQEKEELLYNPGFNELAEKISYFINR